MTPSHDVGLALLQTADAAFSKGKMAEAETAYRKALTLLMDRAQHIPKALARGLIRWAICLKAGGDVEASADALERAVVLAQAHRAFPHAAEAARLRAALAELAGDSERFEQWSTRALTAYGEAGDAAGSAMMLMSLGRARRLRAQYGDALELFEKALGIADQAELSILSADALAHLGNVYRVQGQLDKAAALFERAMRIGEEEQNRGLVARALTDLGNVAVARGKWDNAVERYEHAAACYASVGQSVAAAATACNLAGIWMLRGELKRALHRVTQSRQVLSADVAPNVVVDTMLLQAQICAKSGSLAECDRVLSAIPARLAHDTYSVGERRLASFQASRKLLDGEVTRAREMHADVVARMRGVSVVADEISALLSAVAADLAAEAYDAADARLKRAQALLASRSKGRFGVLIGAGRASLDAQMASDPEQGAGAFERGARDLEDRGYRLEALSLRLKAADLVLPSAAEWLNEGVRCQALGLALTSQSFLCVIHTSSTERFEDLSSRARQAGLRRVEAAIERRRAALHAPHELESLAHAATGRGDLWEARQCRRATLHPA